MKKFLIATITIVCLFGCGKKEVEKVEKKAIPFEKRQTGSIPGEELDFIKNEQGFLVHMKNIKVLLKHLSTSINQQDWDAIKQDTKKLKEASPVAFTGANKNDLPTEFVNLDVKFHLSALELIGASQEQDKDRVTAAFFKVVNSCDECHAKFNPKETSTAWFQ